MPLPLLIPVVSAIAGGGAVYAVSSAAEKLTTFLVVGGIAFYIWKKA